MICTTQCSRLHKASERSLLKLSKRIRVLSRCCDILLRRPLAKCDLGKLLAFAQLAALKKRVSHHPLSKPNIWHAGSANISIKSDSPGSPEMYHHFREAN